MINVEDVEDGYASNSPFEIAGGGLTKRELLAIYEQGFEDGIEWAEEFHGIGVEE